MTRANAFRWVFLVVLALIFAILYDLVGEHLARHQLWIAGTAIGFFGGTIFEGMRP